MAAEASSTEEQVPFVNITGYKFVKMTDDERREFRAMFRTKCAELELKGLILIAPEGFNYFIAGDQKGCDAFRKFLDEEEPSGNFKDIFCKVSYSKIMPFKRCLVKLKNEIIALGDDKIDPEVESGLRLEPEEFKKWLDEGKECVIIDTRNDYELRLGTFKNAMDLNLDSFKEFPAAVDALSPELKDKPIVTFCTGGVRCEKATMVMINKGFKEVYQIEGGILKYFEKCGGAHWDGDCFVFDDRVALNPQLEETGTTMCFKCRAPLTAEDRKHELYVYEKSCQYCELKKKRFHTPPSTTDKKKEPKKKEKKTNKRQKAGANTDKDQKEEEEENNEQSAESGEEGASLSAFKETQDDNEVEAAAEPTSKKCKA